MLFTDLPEEIDVKPAKTDVNPDSETQCYYCGQMFIISTIKDHMINTHGSYFGRQHGPPRPLQCQNCNVSTMSEILKKTIRFSLKSLPFEQFHWPENVSN